MLLRLAIELRVRVQLHTMNKQEFHTTDLAFRDRESEEVEVVSVEV